MAEWVQTALLAVNLGWTTLCLGGYRAETMVITSALTGALLVAHLVSRIFSASVVPNHPAGWLLVPFLLYAAGNAAWISPVRWLARMDWFWWAQMIAVFWVVVNGIRSRAPRRALFFTLIALAVAGVVMGCHQRFVSPNWLPFGQVRPPQFEGRASGPFGIPNSFAALLLLLLPAVGAIAASRHGRATERVWWGWLGLVLGCGLVLTISRGAWIALALALASWPLVAGGGRWWRRAAGAIVILAIVGGLTAVAFQTLPKVRDRFVLLSRDTGERSRPLIWRVAWALFREAPLFGTGAGSYNVLFEKHRPEGFLDEPQWAHNEYLNTVSDYGVSGAALFFGAGIAIALGCARRKHAAARREHDWFDASRTTVGLAIGLLAFALQLSVDFHFKIPALGIAFATIAAMVVSRLWPVRPAAGNRGWRRSIGALAAVAVAIITVTVFVPAFRAEGRRDRARRSIDRLAAGSVIPAQFRERVTEAREDLSRAVGIDPANAQAWADLAYAISLQARTESGRDAELGREAESAAHEAVIRCVVAYEFWIRRGIALDMQSRWLEAGNDFAHAVVLAPQTPLAWYYHAEHLSRLPAERGLAEAALAFCLRLDPGNRAGLALRQRLAIRSQLP